MALNPDPMSAVQIAFVPLTGVVEHGLSLRSGAAQTQALWLLQAVTSGVWRNGQPVELADLTVAQFDGCLAALYRSLYGERLPSEGTCTSCSEPFELSFDLGDLQERLMQDVVGFEGDHDGQITAPSGRVFRLPRVVDLEQLPLMDPEDWLRALLESGDFDGAALQDEIAAAGPVLSQNIDAPCPMCGHVNAVRFDMAAYLVGTLEREVAFVWREVHLIALHYGWLLDDILALSRDLRRKLTGLIVGEASRMRMVS